jgi:chromosome partitioning protein
MAQVITVLQQKGGAGKSTLLAGLASIMLADKARVLVIDTDPQQTIKKWADKPACEATHHFQEKEDELAAIIASQQDKFDFIFIDTGGFESMMAVHAIMASDLILIPSKASEPDAQGAFKTFNHVKAVSASLKRELPAYVILNDVDKLTKMTDAIRKLFDDKQIPRLNAAMYSRTGFKEMLSTGAAPTGSALSVMREVVAELQMLNAIEYRKAA